LALCPAFLKRLAVSEQVAPKAATGKAKSVTAEIPKKRFNIAFSLSSAYARVLNKKR
jgi:hypothetical protein